ncbi:MAG: AMP-binding protein [Sulfuricaulis sp.]
MNALPLLPDLPSRAIIAYRNARPVRRNEFLGDVLTLAGRLPDAGQVLNLCNDRYLFTVGLFAAISRGLISLLPNSHAAAHIRTLCAGNSNLVCLGEQEVSPIGWLPYVRVSDMNRQETVSPGVPQILFDQTIVCVHTSGSTGQPQAHRKTFGRMHRCACTQAGFLWPITNGPCAVVGTVPFRHMYGLETTVLLPMLGGGQLCNKTPFFPADVVSTLEELPFPRILVTTPFHLRKILDANIEVPKVAAVLSATAPLSRELACQAETRFSAPLIEIYGSTETGQMATRRSAMQSEWRTIAGITLRQEEGATIASGGHLEYPQALNDMVELISESDFRLVDRHVNLVNVAGKRSSLAFLNHLITCVPGIVDGVFCVPRRDDGGEVARLGAFVVAPGLKSADILAALRSHLDPVFLPRPLVMLNNLPRDDNGKIVAVALDALIAEHMGQNS